MPAIFNDNWPTGALDTCSGARGAVYVSAEGEEILAGTYKKDLKSVCAIAKEHLLPIVFGMQEASTKSWPWG